MIKIPETAKAVYYDLNIANFNVGFREGPQTYLPYGWIIDGSRREEGWVDLVDGMRFTTRTGVDFIYNAATGDVVEIGTAISPADMLNKIAQVANGSLIERVGGEVFLLLSQKRVKLGCTMALEMIRANGGSMKVEFNSDERAIWTLEKAPVFTGDHSENATAISAIYKEVCDGQ